MTGVLSAGDRIRAMVQLGRDAREADAECDRIWMTNAPGSLAAIDAADARFTRAVHGITDHLAALEATGVLECIAEAADLFEAGRS